MSMLTRSRTLRWPNHADTRSASRPAAVDGRTAGTSAVSLRSAPPTAGNTSVISLIAPCTPACGSSICTPVPRGGAGGRTPAPPRGGGSLVRRASLLVLQLDGLRLRRHVVRIAQVDDGHDPGALRQLGQRDLSRSGPD